MLLDLRGGLCFLGLTGDIVQHVDQLGTGRPFSGNVVPEAVREHAPEFRKSSR